MHTFPKSIMIWTQVAVSISYYDIHYIMSTPYAV